MRKIYIMPRNRVCDIEAVALIAASNDPDITDGDATQGAAGTNTDINGGGDGYARRQNLWDTEW